eukprot:682533-Heterocapsa_arctica.AAC.1
MFDTLSKFACPGPHVHPVHHPCAGNETKKSELHTDQMTNAIHGAIKEDAIEWRARIALAALKMVRGVYDEAYDEAEMDEEAPARHCEKSAPKGMWCTMVTKTLAPKDPKSRSPP